MGYPLAVEELEAVGDAARHVVPLGNQAEPERERLLCQVEELLQAGRALGREQRIPASVVGGDPEDRQHVRVRSLGGREGMKREGHLDERRMRLARHQLFG